MKIEWARSATRPWIWLMILIRGQSFSHRAFSFWAVGIGVLRVPIQSPKVKSLPDEWADTPETPSSTLSTGIR